MSPDQYDPLDCAVAAVLGFDRTLPRSVAEAEVGNQVTGSIGGENPWRVSWREHHNLVVHVPYTDVPPVEDEKTYGGHPANRRYFAFLGRWLAERLEEAERAIQQYAREGKRPPPYSTDWNTFMEHARPWLVMEERRERFFAALRGSGLLSPDAHQATQAAVLQMTPESACRAILIAAGVDPP